MADLGGSIITGIDGNPLAVLAAQLNIPLHDINTAGVPLYLEDGRVPDARIDKKVAMSVIQWCTPNSDQSEAIKLRVLKERPLLLPVKHREAIVQ